MGVNWTAIASTLETMLRHGRPAKGAPVFIRRIRPYPISRYQHPPGSTTVRDWVAAPPPEWIARYESADVPSRHFMVGFQTPPEIPGAVLPTVERHQGEWLFSTIAITSRGAQLQWASHRDRPPWAGWQVFLLRSSLLVIQYRRLVARKTAAWVMKGIVAVGLAVGGPLAAWWIINHLLE